ncbi:hypothetical protein [Amycolatopsis sp. NPDC059657]|uniref:hypothetical protein n=1 Tax=Amycolatopsis sp. NPDC059657 TaxID=3346899 RepID=UPI00367359B7
MRNKLSAAVAALSVALISGVAMTPAAQASDLGFVFVHNVSHFQVVKVCVDESDSTGKRIYHKCRGLTDGAKWGHRTSANAAKLWVHLGTAGFGSENYGPFSRTAKVCFRPDSSLPDRPLPENQCTFG